jgi:hypothetical protein
VDRDEGAESRFWYWIAALLAIAVVAIVFAASREAVRHRPDDTKLTRTERKATSEELERSMREVREMIDQKENPDKTSRK